MKPLLLDRNVVSAMRAPHRQPPEFQRWFHRTDPLSCHVSSLTWLEIETGILKKRRTDPAQAQVLTTWFQTIQAEYQRRTIPFNDATAIVTAPLMLLRSRGSIDTLIAGTALTHGMDLVTRNVADFADIPGLSVVNPW